MHWFSTGLLIALTAGTAVWTGYLVRRLFVVEPAASAAPAAVQGTDDPNAEEPTA
ncbi:hypothetical protein [Pseudonocardia endophytica]|uniref:Uncharacterized protein n=1 Tax=Pseudonocardia endophytica TaxID=401976 RepID=A0A4R1HZP8_PSEEN|nr:hypothetical protein [Pseudonocardia endophytica]TCK27063.1 hypothetical protein EV378_2918 [Pseudonocardia endophytica]